MNITNLRITWSTSRGQDTYGYNICRLDDSQTGKRYKCMGGGYDMTGTVFGEWLADRYQAELLELAARSYYIHENGEGYKVREVTSSVLPVLYGMTLSLPEKSILLDGACGISSMIAIAEAIGLEVQYYGDKKGHTLGFLVSRKEQS